MSRLANVGYHHFSYTAYKLLYEKVKPIRGRSEEVRPIGNRRRDWEQITRRVLGTDAQGDPEYSYIAQLYGTDVVEYMPNGDVILRTNGWHTPSTAEFIHEHSPFTCWKQHKQLWVRARNADNEVTAYPISHELKMVLSPHGQYIPAQPIKIKKRVVDRDKARIAREPVQPFLQWAKTFLKLSDGWVMHETCKEALGGITEYEEGWRKGVPAYVNFPSSKEAVYELITSPKATDETYLMALCAMAHSHLGAYESQVAEVVSFHLGVPRKRVFEDVRVSIVQLREIVYRWVRAFEDVDKIIEVDPQSTAIYRAA